MMLKAQNNAHGMAVNLSSGDFLGNFQAFLYQPLSSELREKNLNASSSLLLIPLVTIVLCCFVGLLVIGKSPFLSKADGPLTK